MRRMLFVFFFNDTATTEIYTLSLHDALPIFGSILLVSRAEVMINRDSWGHSYLTVRGEILGFVKDGLLRKHLPRMFSLIKNES